MIETENTERRTNMKNEQKPGCRIAYYRRLHGMTQEELSKCLNVSAQAVSKWEQQLTSPDIMLLPAIADVFHISVDELFGRQVQTEPVYSLVDNVPWEDDRKIRIAVYHGKKLIQQTQTELHSGENTVILHFDYGEAYKINGVCKLNKE